MSFLQCGPIGSHSVALLADGSLYSWGAAYCTGVQVTKVTTVPALVDTFPLNMDKDDEHDADDEGQDEPTEPTASTASTTIFGSVPCKDVSCGGGFTVAVMGSGRVCSWGMWSHGRLGLGSIPSIRSARSK